MTGGSFYDELGVAPGASVEEMRAAYRQRARQLHPDVAGGAGAGTGTGGSGDAMRKLNAAWAVLGDAEQRRRYDAALSGDAPSPGRPAARAYPSAATAYPSPASGDPGPAPSRRRPAFLRPSVLILAVLALIFVVTAYAGSPPGNQTGPTPTTPQTPSTIGGSASVRPIGQCLAGSDAAGDVNIVPCSTRHFGQILAEAATPAQCPTGTVARPWALRPTVLCTVESAPAP